MFYEFKAKDGEVIDRQYPMSEAPELGTKIKVEGKVFVRMISTDIEVVEEFIPYVARSKPKGLPGCRVDKKSGHSVIENKKQEREIARVRGEVWN